MCLCVLLSLYLIRWHFGGLFGLVCIVKERCGLGQIMSLPECGLACNVREQGGLGQVSSLPRFGLACIAAIEYSGFDLN